MNPRSLFLLPLLLVLAFIDSGCQPTTVPVRTPTRIEAGTVRPREYHYDASGRYIGYSESRGTRRMNYDASGRWIGHTEQRNTQ